MRFFLLLLTMLIVASEPFFVRIHGEKVLTSKPPWRARHDEFSVCSKCSTFPGRKASRSDHDVRYLKSNSFTDVDDPANLIVRTDNHPINFVPGSHLIRCRKRKFPMRRKRKQKFGWDSILNSRQWFGHRLYRPGRVPFSFGHPSVRFSCPPQRLQKPRTQVLVKRHNQYNVFNNKNRRKFLKLSRKRDQVRLLTFKRQCLAKLNHKRSAVKSNATEETSTREEEITDGDNEDQENEGDPEGVSNGFSNRNSSSSTVIELEFPTEAQPQISSTEPTIDGYPHHKESCLELIDNSTPDPKLDFKSSQNTKLHKSSFKNENNDALNPIMEEKSDAEEEKADAEQETEEAQEDKSDSEGEMNKASDESDVTKLKEMLEEVESVLKDENNEAVVQNPASSSNRNLKAKIKSDSQSNQTSHCADRCTRVKEKIDKVAIPLLAQISEELTPKNRTSAGDTNSNNSGNSTNSSVTARACTADGAWFSTVIGLKLTITTLPNMLLKVSVTPSKEEAEINQKWCIHGLTLSKSGGPLILAAIYPQKRKIASFIGQCKVCHGGDFIFGSWTIFTFSQTYRDIWKSVETKLDVLQRVNFKEGNEKNTKKGKKTRKSKKCKSDKKERKKKKKKS